MYHSHLIKPPKFSNINTPKLYEGIPSLSFAHGRIQSFEEQKYQHKYTPIKDGQNLLKHVLKEPFNRQNYRKHRA